MFLPNLRMNMRVNAARIVLEGLSIPLPVLDRTYIRMGKNIITITVVVII
jgi:hypothetical protein